MHIQKIGHCCLVIDTKDVRIVTDPGKFTSETHAAIEGVHIVLITHEHADHIHVESLKALLDKNPDAKVITNSGVGKVLDDAGIAYEKLEGRDVQEVLGITLEAVDEKHVEIYEEFGQVQNTGYFIDNTLLYPGDSYAEIHREVAVLALPVAGPWCKLADALRYAIRVNPKQAFPVHDGLLAEERAEPHHRVPKVVLEEHNIEFVPMLRGDTLEV